MYHKQENCLDTCFLRLLFLFRGLFLNLLQQSLFKILFNEESFQGAQWQVSLLFDKKGKLAKMTTPCHSSFAVTRFHSLSFFASCRTTRCTTRCHPLSLVVIRPHLLYHLLSPDVSLVCLFINDRLISEKKDSVED